MKFSATTIDPNLSFIYFLYPFTFEPHTFDRRVEAVSNHQFPGRSFATWKPKKIPTDDLLFHVCNYFHPSGDRPPTAQFWSLDNGLRDFLRLRKTTWQLVCPLGEIPFYWGESGGEGNQAVQLALFKVGVGFLILRSQPLSCCLNQWLNFLHYFRFVKGQRDVALAAQKDEWNPNINRTELKAFIPETAKSTKADRFLLEALIQSWLNIAVLDNESQWYEDVFVPGQLIPFSGIYVNQFSEEETPHLLYRLQNFFHEAQGEHPSGRDLQSDCQPWMPYAERMWWIFSLEGSSFVAIDPPEADFFRQTLPDHLHQQYFLLFLLALHQRFALMSLSAQVAESWVTDDDTRLQHFQEIRDRLLLFTARGYFAQVMQREHHHRCYRQWQEVFQLDILYREVNEEVREMHEYAQIRQNQRLEKTIQVVGVAVGAGGIAASSMSAYIQQPVTLKPTGTIHPGFLAAVLSLAIAAIAGGFTWWILDAVKGRKRKS